MKIIVGLGNPGKTYENTRHNMGYILIDHLREIWGFSPWSDSRFSGLISEGTINGEKVLLLKPTTYMNLSGEAVTGGVNFYKLDPKTDLFVLVDDLDMEFGKIRVRARGSSGGQNGIKSIIASLGTDEFARIKVGIGRDERYTVSDWVLSRLTSEERKILEEEIFPQVQEKVELFLEA